MSIVSFIKPEFDVKDTIFDIGEDLDFSQLDKNIQNELNTFMLFLNSDYAQKEGFEDDFIEEIVESLAHRLMDQYEDYQETSEDNARKLESFINDVITQKCGKTEEFALEVFTERVFEKAPNGSILQKSAQSSLGISDGAKEHGGLVGGNHIVDFPYD